MFSEPSEAVRDTLWKHIYIPSGLYKAVNTPDFIRLTRIKQLGPASIVYPGATHTRAAHSFGVYHIAIRILQRLLDLGAQNWTTDTGRRSFAVAALFHDIGHFPFTHSLKELPLMEHEQLTAKQIQTSPLYEIIGAWGANPQQAATIIDDSIQTTDTETLFFRRLLSGVLDPDKLDYLNRDAFFCGVPYGTQDIDFILSRILPDKERGISLDSNGISAVESLLFSKYLMYSAVYWHHSVRMATAMMKKTIIAALNAKLIEAEELYALDDESLYYLLDTRYAKAGKSKFPEYICAQELREHRLYVPIIEIPFNSADERHTKLENLEHRTKLEHLLADELACKPEEVLLDIPERISFESDLWISDKQVSFSKSTTVFSDITVNSFVSVLRKIRVGIKQKHLTLSDKEIKNNVAKYL